MLFKPRLLFLSQAYLSFHDHIDEKIAAGPLGVRSGLISAGRVHAQTRSRALYISQPLGWCWGEKQTPKFSPEGSDRMELVNTTEQEYDIFCPIFRLVMGIYL